MPEGEAPEWVRKEWIGLRLPLYCYVSRTNYAQGVVTGNKVPCGSGYSVIAIDALNILSPKSPGAVEWWKETSIYKEQGITGYVLIFNEGACQIIN